MLTKVLINQFNRIFNYFYGKLCLVIKNNKIRLWIVNKERYMYTYEAFETLGVFALLRPVFITFLAILILLFLILISTKKNIINGLTVIILSFISILVSGQLLYDIGIIADETNLGGDSVSFYMFFAILALSFINPLIYFNKFIEIKNNEV